MLSEAGVLTVPKEVLARSTSDWKKEKKALASRIAEASERAIVESHQAVVSWAQDVHALFPDDVSKPSIELSFSSIQRSLGFKGHSLSEIDVLLAGGHAIVLGDPGAGKTTTLRRLASLVSLGGELADEDQFRFVIVIVCRQEDWSREDALERVLADRVGMTGKIAGDVDDPNRLVRDILNGGALILIDGLDEVAAAHKDRLWTSLQVLGHRLHGAKVIASCRSGAYISRLEGFTSAEIEPLTPDQIRAAVEQVLGDQSAAFFEAIHADDNPAAELADRPLFLMQMVKVFRRRASIPSRPVDLYEAIVNLVLHEWDESRRIQRASAYASFSVDDKRRFLADIALDLIQRDIIQFTTPELIDVLRRIGPRYELPSTAAREVVREIESHTGLIVQMGPEEYEFSHLSLHEYLAADALVRGGRPSETLLNIKTVPEVAAVAIALASDANALLNGFTRDLRDHSQSFDVPSLHAFLYRLGQERPRFMPSETVGHDLLYLLVKGTPSGFEMSARIGTQLSAAPTARKSVNLALERYRFSLQGGLLGLHFEERGTPRVVGTVPPGVLAELVGVQRVNELSGRADRDRIR